MEDGGLVVNVKVKVNGNAEGGIRKAEKISVSLRLSGKRWPRRSGALQEVREGDPPSLLARCAAQLGPLRIGPHTPPPTFAGSPPGWRAWVLTHPRNDPRPFWQVVPRRVGFALTRGNLEGFEVKVNGNAEGEIRKAEKTLNVSASQR